MQGIDYRSALLERIKRLLDGSWSVPAFRSQYYDFFVDGVPNSALSDVEEEFFGRVQEKLDWVDEDPDPESRRYGWINHAEFVEWLRRELKTFLDSSEPDAPGRLH